VSRRRAVLIAAFVLAILLPFDVGPSTLTTATFVAIRGDRRHRLERTDGLRRPDLARPRVLPRGRRVYRGEVGSGPALERGAVDVVGPFDFSVGQSLDIAGLTIDHNGLYCDLALGLLALATAFAYNVRRSSSGRAMFAVREREAAASVIGVNVGRVKIDAFVCSSSRGHRRRRLRLLPQLRAAE
jgi:hypothetical protein